MQDNFYNYCLSESARRDQSRDTDRVRHCTLIRLRDIGPLTFRQGVFTGLDQETDNQQLRDALPRIRRKIKEYGSSFSERAQVIVHGLQSHTDLDCRFLGIRLSFSDFYKSKKEQQVQQQQKS
jgi:gamma-tubulin complex component 3